MKKFFAIPLALLLLACSPVFPNNPYTPTKPAPVVSPVAPVLPALPAKEVPACAILYMQAQASSQPVRGFWNCLSPSIQASFVSRGYTPDDSAFATDTGFQVSYSYVGPVAGNGYVFQIAAEKDGKKGGSIFVIYIDPAHGIINTAWSTPIKDFG